MRFRFHAVDERGRVVREVLSAGDEDEAREMLLGENLFPKKLETVGEEEKVTWVSRKYVQTRHDEHRAKAGAQHRRDDLKFAEACRTVLSEGGTKQEGRIGITEEGKVYFVPVAKDQQPQSIEAGEVESIRLGGFPARTLKVFMLDGKLLEFTAGIIFSHPTMKMIARKLKETK